ncbi:hypothetical protein B0H14DRAFT_2615063 [Mycena olivaceomarginata]|nr:hypothetical protein B0H14DRAFT_2615063 [Mycena olivaceomarginata]
MHFTPKSSFVALASALASTLVAAAPAVIGKATTGSATIGAASAATGCHCRNGCNRRSTRLQPPAPPSLTATSTSSTTDANFGGDCTDYGFTNNVCSNLPSEFQDDISSFGPDAGWVCAFYTDTNCSGGIYAGANPGFTDIPGWLNDAFSSYSCGASN